MGFNSAFKGLNKLALYNLCSLLRHRKFLSLYKFLCPTFNMWYGSHFHLLSSNITNCVLISCSCGGNKRSGTAKRMAGSVSLFDLLHYDMYFNHIIFRVYFQCLFPFTYKFVDGKIFLFAHVNLQAVSTNMQLSVLNIFWHKCL